MIDERGGKISFGGHGTVVEHTFEELLKIENKRSMTFFGDIERKKSAHTDLHKILLASVRMNRGELLRTAPVRCGCVVPGRERVNCSLRCGHE